MSSSERMSPTDHLLWIGDRHTDLRSTIVAVAIFAGAPTRQALAERYERVSNAVPRLRQRVQTNPVSIAPPRWEVDPDFDVQHHVRWAPPGVERTLDDVLAIAAAKALEPFPTDRPLWEITAIPELPNGEFALVQKIHHAVTDGVNGVRIQLELLDFEADPNLAPTLEPDDDAPLSQAERVRDALRWDLRRRAGIADSVISTIAKTSKRPAASVASAAETVSSLARVSQLPSEPLSPLMIDRTTNRSFRTISLSLSDAKAAGRAAGVKLNGVYLAGIADGLRRYHQRHGTPATKVRMGMPISTRSDDSDAGNAFSAARFVIPLFADTPGDLARTMHQLVESNRTEKAVDLMGSMAAQLTRLPAPAATRLFRRAMRGTDVQASNVPGSPVPMWLLGNKLLRQFPFGPTTTSALNITMLSYRDSLDIGVAMNVGAVPDPDAMVEDLNAGFGAIIDG